MKSKIFISYSRHDIEFTRHFVSAVKDKTGVTPWVDLKGIETGEQFDDVIVNAIDNCDMLIFLISNSSLQSMWTKKEVLYAKNIGKKVYPVLIEEVEQRGWFYFEFGRIDCVNYNDEIQREKLFVNLVAQLGVSPQTDSPMTSQKTADKKHVKEDASAADKKYEIYLRKAKRFKSNDGKIDEHEHQELQRLADRLGIDPIQQENLIEEIESEYDRETACSPLQKDVGSADKIAASAGESNSDELVMQVVLSAVNRYSCKGLFIGEAFIPSDKIQGFRTFVPSEEHIVAALDATVFGSAKHGLALTNWGLHWHNDWTTSSPVCSCSWQTFVSRGVLEIRGSSVVIVEGGVYDNSAGDMSTKDVVEMLLKLKKAVAAVCPSDAAETKAVASENNDIASLIIDILADLSEESFLYRDWIPSKKREAAETLYQIPADEHILALLDTTLLGSMKAGMVITDKAFRWKNGWTASDDTVRNDCFWREYSSWPVPVVNPNDDDEILFGKQIIFNNVASGVPLDKVLLFFRRMHEVLSSHDVSI